MDRHEPGRSWDRLLDVPADDNIGALAGVATEEFDRTVIVIGVTSMARSYTAMRTAR